MKDSKAARCECCVLEKTLSLNALVRKMRSKLNGKNERRTLLHWVRQGKLRAYILSGTQRHVWRFKTSDLDAMLSVPAVLSIAGRTK
jgi:hypothetical protein